MKCKVLLLKNLIDWSRRRKNSSKHKNAKVKNKKFAAGIIHSEYKYVLFYNKCLRHSMNRIQSENHKVGTYENNEISLSCFDDKIYILNNRYDGLALGY